MEVTTENFNEALKLMSSALDHCSFVAIDGEFTGLHSGSNPSVFDTPEERYQHIKENCCDFLLIQLGVCIFKYEKQKKGYGYVAYPFNFYVFPRPSMRAAPDQRFLCQSSSIDFLVSHGFDFNKLFYKGIGYLTAVDNIRVKEMVQQRHAQYEGNASLLSDSSPNFSSPSVAKKPVEVPEEHKPFIDDVCKRVADFTTGSTEELELEPCTGYQRKLVYQTIKSRYPSGLHLDTHTTEDKKERFIVVRRVTEEEKKKLAQEKLQAELEGQYVLNKLLGERADTDTEGTEQEEDTSSEERDISREEGDVEEEEGDTNEDDQERDEGEEDDRELEEENSDEDEEWLPEKDKESEEDDSTEEPGTGRREEMEQDDQEMAENAEVEVGSTAEGKARRISRACPICGKVEKYLSTHLKRVHKLTDKEKRSKALYKARQKKPITWKKQSKSRRKGRDCALCGARNLQRLDIHLRVVHNVAKGAEVRKVTRAMKQRKAAVTGEAARDIYHRFQRHLQCLGKAIKTAKGNAAVIRQIGEERGLKRFFTHEDALTLYIMEIREKYLPKTSRARLHAIQEFAEWCLDDRMALEELGIRKSAVKRMCRLAKKYGASLAPAIMSREADLRDEIEDVCLSPVEIKKIDEALRKPALQTTEKLQNGEAITQKELLLMRDFLILRILFRNPQRPGVISNITVKHFNEALLVNGNRVLKVRQHKTQRKYGSANIVADSALWSWLTIYKERGRKQTLGYNVGMEGEDSPLFLSGSGGKIDKVGQTLKRRGESLGLADPSKILPTNIRKSFVSIAHDTGMSPKRRERMANFMCHSVPVQEGYYRARQKVARNIEASFDVADLVTLDEGQDMPGTSGTNIDHRPDAPPTSGANTVDPGQENLPADDVIPPTVVRSAKGSIGAAEDVGNMSDFEEDHSEEKDKTRRLRLLSPEREARMIKLMGIAVTNNSVRKKKRAFRTLTNDVYAQMNKEEPLPCNAKQFYDKARHMKLVTPEIPLLQKEDESDEHNLSQYKKIALLNVGNTDDTRQGVLLFTDEVDEASGICRVMKMISESGKVVVGHNMLLDVIHMMHQFTGPLPDTLTEFKSMVGCIFSRLLDTKVMANTQPFKELFPMNGLTDLLCKCDEEPFKKPQIVMPPSNFSDYTTNQKFHEAAYDAYVTGVCFATMANYLGSFLTPPKPRVSPTSNLIEPFLNKLFLHRSADIPYLNLDGPDLQPCRDHIFHVRFPSEWKSSDLYDLFSPFGNVMISWIDDTSAMVGLMKKDRASQVLSTIEKSSVYQVTSYADYKKSQYMAGDFIPFPAFQETAPVGSSEAETPKSPRGKKRSIDESLDDKSGDFDPEVASFMASTAKKHKQMDPNAAPFVSRRSVTPPTSSSSGVKLDRTSSEDNEAAAKEPTKLFEESSSW